MTKNPRAKSSRAEIVREYGPFEGAERVHGVTYDGRSVWFATGDALRSLDPESGRTGARLEVSADAGSAFDGTHLYQLAGGVIQRVDPASGRVLSTLPSPAAQGSAGLTWAEGTLWVAHYEERMISQLDPRTGEVLRTIPSTRFVTGVTFVDGELWHATWENDESELRHVAQADGEVLETLTLPAGVNVSGLESNGRDVFYCGSGGTGKVRAVRRAR